MMPPPVDVSDTFWEFVRVARTGSEGSIARTAGYAAIADATARCSSLSLRVGALWQQDDGDGCERAVFGDATSLFDGAEAMLRARPEGVALANEVRACTDRIRRMLLTSEAAEGIASMCIAPK